ncbi:sarcosine oxidase subunit alpha family protein [Methylobacterium platani]|uniref:Sarcosine oxidase subunit alpha n=2 Tax=Methylobacterium platani TaxID=427683 RepID=A0A179S1E0_9HYPH|nr:sarcosine oxidase subunit alpha family protein [Methylobacterium platani]KMO16121.1 sarcosine oxidase subunit alpha [Methylobacterium platani JCM 14648]OAS15563.1 sarcosine oxidase subunit alpha [Methylobacterium platani]
MAQPFRLSRGGRIDRARPVRFTFNGRTIEGFHGDSVASALLANGIHLVGRSFKYHRPRGILSHGPDEPSALLSVDRGPGRIDPNNRASVVEARDGLKTLSQNHWPSLEHDIGAVNDLLSPVFVAGFYYKTFMWPRKFWDKVYEPFIRAAAGLGKAPAVPDPDRYANRHAHCDVLVVGAGPAGLAAALAAARTGKRVILADEGPEPGGALLHDVTAEIDGRPASEWLSATLAELDSRENVILLSRTTAFGYYNHNHVALAERVTDHLPSPGTAPRERLWQVRAGEVVLAGGSHERPLVFADNDRPGILLAESVRVFVNRYGVAPGRRIVFATSGASAYAAALDAKAAGLAVTLVDLRSDSECGPELARLKAAGVEVLTGHTVIGSKGTKRVTGLIVAPVDRAGRCGAHRVLDCDCVGMSGGWTPAVHLFSQSRGKLAYDERLDAFLPGTSAQAERSAGASKGTYDLAAILAEGFAAGAAAAGSDERRSFTATPTLTGFRPVRAMPTDADPTKVRAFVDFQNDVTAKDIKLAVREGFHSIEHVKRYTTTGMATDQGKTSNMNALGIVAGQLDKTLPGVGTTTFRPPYTPVTFGALVGPARHALFDPIRTTPIHDWAEEHGATFENVALWRRAWYFPKAGEDLHKAVARECEAVRRGVGIFDASTLGKIEVVGPDAAEFMNRIYINPWLKLEVGRCRYGLMLKEDGYILDDGVVARIAPDCFHVTTTTGGAPRVLAHMEDYLQTEWPDLKVFLTSTTEQWAVIALQGPKAREVIAPLVDGIDLSPEAFPHMAMRSGTICGVPTRLFRVSFTGELGFEINVPSDHARAVWEAIWEAGQPHGITPYGTETMHVLRAEKGYIIIGQETDGTVTPDDVGLAGMIAKAKKDFVGKRSLARPDVVASGRKQLVGLVTDDPKLVLDEGAQIVADPGQPIPMRMLGHVTSSYWSPNCGRSIAMALVADGRALQGGPLHVTTPEGFARVTVVDPVFFDPKGERIHA